MRMGLFAIVFLFCTGLSSSAAAQTIATGFLDRTLTIAGESYRYQVYVPAD